jgi:hypothetical protein
MAIIRRRLEYDRLEWVLSAVLKDIGHFPKDTDEYHELHSFGKEVFYTKVRKNWIHTEGTSISTFFYIALRNMMINHLKYQSIRKKTVSDTDYCEGYDGSYHFPNPERLVIFKDLMEKQSGDCQFVLRLLCSKHPTSLFKSYIHGDMPPKIIRGQLRRYLKHEQQWSGERVRTVFRELKSILSYQGGW